MRRGNMWLRLLAVSCIGMLTLLAQVQASGMEELLAQSTRAQAAKHDNGHLENNKSHSNNNNNNNNNNNKLLQYEEEGLSELLKSVRHTGQLQQTNKHAGNKKKNNNKNNKHAPETEELREAAKKSEKKNADNAKSEHKNAKSEHKNAKSEHKNAKSVQKNAKSDQKNAKSEHREDAKFENRKNAQKENKNTKHIQFRGAFEGKEAAMEKITKNLNTLFVAHNKRSQQATNEEQDGILYSLRDLEHEMADMEKKMAATDGASRTRDQKLEETLQEINRIVEQEHVNMNDLARNNRLPYSEAVIFPVGVPITNLFFKCSTLQRTFSKSKYYSFSFPTTNRAEANEYIYYAPRSEVANQNAEWKFIGNFDNILECAKTANTNSAVMFKYEGRACRTSTLEYCPVKHEHTCSETSQPVYYSTVFSGTMIVASSCTTTTSATTITTADTTTECPPEVCAPATLDSALYII